MERLPHHLPHKVEITRRRKTKAEIAPGGGEGRGADDFQPTARQKTHQPGRRKQNNQSVSDRPRGSVNETLNTTVLLLALAYM